MEFVLLVRTLRNGKETTESMPRWLAELALANVEPNVARAIIRPYTPVVNPKSVYRNVSIPSTRSALAMGRILWSTNPGGLQA